MQSTTEDIILPGKLLRPYNLTEIAALYGICNRTMKKWLKPFEEEIGQRSGRLFNVKQIRVIVLRLGMPPGL